MKENKRFILDVTFTKEELERINYEHKLQSAKTIALTTESVWGFQLLVQHPRLYRLLKHLPHINEDKSVFFEYFKHNIEKIRYVKALNFELAKKHRDLEKEALNTIIADFHLKSINMKEFVLKNGMVKLVVVLLIR